MSNNPKNENIINAGIIVTFILFLGFQFFGSGLFENNWSFTHVSSTPLWYFLIPFISCIFLYILFRNKYSFVESVLENRKSQIILFLLFVIIFVIFQFDSFVYGGGNYKINQIAQVETIMYRFYEFGTVLFVSLFYKILALFISDSNTAGVWGWKLQTYFSVALVFISSILLSKKISKDSQNRFLLFFALFFGPQTLTYFGFVGYTTLLTALIYFFVYFALLSEHEKSLKNLGLLWLITLLSISIQISLMILIPALLFVAFQRLFRKNSVSFIIGLIAYLVLLVGLYQFGGSQFIFTKFILFIGHHNMNVRYDLFSSQHISDIIQILFLFIPQILVLILLFLMNIKKTLTNFSFQLAILLSLCSITLIFIIEPTNSIILDAPTYTAYLSPMIILLLLYIKESKKLLQSIAVLGLFVPLFILPTYTHIENAEKHVAPYLEKNHHFYIEGATAIQDSYFYLKKIDQANYWYTNLPKLSRDFLDNTAAGEYTYARMYPEALKLYYQLKSKFPYWGEPRAQIASISMAQNRFQIARAEIDTCLMINPYAKEFITLDYSYYRNIGSFLKSKEIILQALELFPNDFDMQTDLAVAYYRLGAMKEADSVATYVIQNDTTQAFAYLIRGFVSELNKNPDAAIEFFKQFIKLAPDEPETPQIRKRLNDLIVNKK